MAKNLKHFFREFPINFQRGNFKFRFKTIEWSIIFYTLSILKQMKSISNWWDSPFNVVKVRKFSDGCLFYAEKQIFDVKMWERYSCLTAAMSFRRWKVYSRVKMSSLYLANVYCISTVECVYCTEPKATCRQCKNQPNAYNMYTDLEGILSACLHLHLSVYPGVVNFCRYVFSQL